MQMDEEARQLVRRMALALHPIALNALDAQVVAISAEPPIAVPADLRGAEAFNLFLAATAALSATVQPER